MWNSAEDKSNFTVRIYTENLDCDYKGMKLYGQEFSPSALVVDGLTDDYLLAATFYVMNLYSSSNIEGLNRCIYHQVCDGGCNYISVSILKREEEAGWKICEVTTT